MDAFTLIELLVVLVIMAGLATTAFRVIDIDQRVSSGPQADLAAMDRADRRWRVLSLRHGGVDVYVEGALVRYRCPDGTFGEMRLPEGCRLSRPGGRPLSRLQIDADGCSVDYLLRLIDRPDERWIYSGVSGSRFLQPMSPSEGIADG